MPRRASPATTDLPRRGETLAGDMALAFLLFRYVGHVVPGGRENARASLKTFGRARRALAMAKQAGCAREYLRLMMDVPLLSVTVEDLGE